MSCSTRVKLYNFHIPVAAGGQRALHQQFQYRRRLLFQGGQFNYVRGLGLLKTVEDIGEVPVGSNNGAPVRIKDIGHVVIGHAPRLGIFGFEKNPDAVEGVILMRRGEQTQNVLQGVEKKTEELNRSVLPPDVKIRPYYDRSDWFSVTTDTVEGNLLRGMLFVIIVLIFFLGSVRAALIIGAHHSARAHVRVHLPESQRRRGQPAFHRSHRFRHHHRRHIVMVENIYRELGLRHGQQYKLHDVIVAAARDVDRPIFYSVAVIIAGYLPIYALTGPAGLSSAPWPTPWRLL